MSDTETRRRFLDEEGLARYDAHIKAYIAGALPLAARHDLTTPAGAAGLTFQDGAWSASAGCMRFRGPLAVPAPAPGDYQVTVEVQAADGGCALSVGGEAYTVPEGRGNTIFTTHVTGERLEMRLTGYAWLRSVTLTGKQPVPTRLSQLENDACYLRGGQVDDAGALILYND